MMIDSKTDGIVHSPRDSRAQDATAAWRTYEEQRRLQVGETELRNERPPEEGKGLYIDVFA